MEIEFTGNVGECKGEGERGERRAQLKKSKKKNGRERERSKEL